ncbi:hypothetical protein P20652_3810 [Pseudoalteromonas sp. BSi20652]|nr:hypothetical protein P20652_3810 [Pseudoalteromonas sp. BSi20652]
MPGFLEDATNELSTSARRYFLGLSEELNEPELWLRDLLTY